MRSVDVVLRRRCAQQILDVRVSSSLNTRLILSFQVLCTKIRSTSDNARMPVRIPHAVARLHSSHRPAASIRRVDQLIREIVHHRLAARPAKMQQPVESKANACGTDYFHRNLVVRATTAPVSIPQRTSVLDALLKISAASSLSLFSPPDQSRRKNTALRVALLAFPHIIGLGR